jgi:hypothetical protein
MARRQKKKTGTAAAINGKRARSTPLPGMEDRGIKALDDVADNYADIRDERMDLTRREHELKVLALKLMKKHDKTIYKHDGIEITVIPGEDDVKVRVQKAKTTTDGDEAVTIADVDQGEYAAERRAAVEAGD